MLLTFTEKVVGSSPFAPTQTPPPGVFALVDLSVVVLVCVVIFGGEIFCNSLLDRIDIHVEASFVE
jgi:hypothetical protein